MPARQQLGVETIAYIAFGANLGDRASTIESAIRAVGRLPTTMLDAVSGIIETDPVGPAGQGTYLNGVMRVRTQLSPRELLDALLDIEHQHGRERETEPRWGARTLDLDVLIFGDAQIDEPGLCIPHPRLHERAFVLIPLCELAPELIIPVHMKTPQAMLGALTSSSDSV